jgi:signal transduction histidine kinase
MISRIPFNPLLGLTEELSQNFNELDKEDIREGLNVIDKSARNIYLLLENLLLWSEVQMGKIAAQSIEFNVSEIINEIHEIFLYSIEGKEIKFIKSLDPGLMISNE